MRSFSQFLAEGVDLAARIRQSGVGSDYVHDLYSDDAEDAMCTDFNLSTVLPADIARAKAALKSASQTALASRGPVLLVYRGLTGRESTRPTVSVTLSKATAQRHAKLGTGLVTTARLRVADVLAYSEAIGKGTFAEEEIICFLKDLS